MNIKLLYKPNNFSGKIYITGSKSESNRLLLLQAIYPNIKLNNVSNSDDTNMIINALKSSKKNIDIHHAGTAMRFLTAYYAFKLNSDIVLTGSERMQNRPIKILIDALKDLGALIEYQKINGFPPIRIKGSKPLKSFVKLSSSTSSQYVSALMLVAPKILNGLTIELFGKTTSLPYIKMTESLLKNIGVKVEFENNKIKIFNKETISNQTITIESDWSSASYFYSIAALSERSIIRLNSYKKKSLQGDDCLIEIYEKLGVSSKFEGDTLVIEKLSDFKNPKRIYLNLINSPDLAQTIAVTCIGLCIDSELHGLHTLKIKETDRLSALKKELTKFGADVHTTEESIHVKSSKKLNQNIKVSTYQDHRMAMAFAPLAIKTSLMIEDASVVNKSYPDFWNDLHKIGFRYV